MTALGMMTTMVASGKVRQCWRCDSPDVVNTKGPAVCAPCRELSHKREMAKPRPAFRYNCRTCGREYVTRSRNRNCPHCVFESLKHPCADCGQQCDSRAERCLACSSARSPKSHESPHWKGGRTKTFQGYVLIKAHGHPRARKSGGNYVREHILVMEAILGRYLLPGESVHHKNGQRDDNRPENLELWVKSQPAGQRAADLLAWAREIIAVYGPLEEVVAEA